MLQTIKVDVNELATGMFISGLDRPWLGTPFLTQGFLLQTQEDIVRVRDYCEFVFIDTHKSVYLTPKLVRQTGGERPRVPVEKIFEGHTITPYQDEVEWGEEHPRAKAALDTLLHDITDDSTNRDNRSLTAFIVFSLKTVYVKNCFVVKNEYVILLQKWLLVSPCHLVY